MRVNVRVVVWVWGGCVIHVCDRPLSRIHQICCCTGTVGGAIKKAEARAHLKCCSLAIAPLQPKGANDEEGWVGER